VRAKLIREIREIRGEKRIVVKKFALKKFALKRFVVKRFVVKRFVENDMLVVR